MALLSRDSLLLSVQWIPEKRGDKRKRISVVFWNNRSEHVGMRNGWMRTEDVSKG